jgi:hypothetical protein
MIERESFESQVRDYRLVQAQGALQDIEARIDALPKEVLRKDAHRQLALLRSRIKALDLSSFGWPPLSASAARQDLLHCDAQRLVSAVICFDHDARRAKVLKYVLKERP